MEYGNYALPIIYWSFLPNIGAKLCQNLLYKFKKPHPVNSPEWARDRNRCYLLVVVIFLIYSVVSAENDLGRNFYHLLGVPVTADDRLLRSAFRAQSLIHHPDKKNGADEHIYVGITTAYEALKDPVKRIAYDHFGIEAFSCEKCLTFKEYLMESFESAGIFYAVSFAIGAAFDLLGNGSFSPYWKLISFFGLIAFEMTLLVSMNDPIPWFLSWRTVHEKIQLARHLFIVFTIAVNQIGPFFFPVDNRSMRQLLMELEANVIREAEQSEIALRKAYEPFRADKKGCGDYLLILGVLKAQMERNFVERILESDPEFQQALEQLRREQNT